MRISAASRRLAILSLTASIADCSARRRRAASFRRAIATSSRFKSTHGGYIMRGTASGQPVQFSGPTSAEGAISDESAPPEGPNWLIER